jgi:hypothetical protein
VVDTDKPDQIEAGNFTLKDLYKVTGRAMLLLELKRNQVTKALVKKMRGAGKLHYQIYLRRVLR